METASQNHSTALAGVAQWIERGLQNQRVAGSIPSQGACLGWGPHERQPPIDISLFFFLPSPLSKNK